MAADESDPAPAEQQQQQAPACAPPPPLCPPSGVLTISPQSSDAANAEVTAAVEELLNSLSNKFAGISSEIFAKMDDMSRRLDSLDAALVDAKAPKEGSSAPEQ